MSGRGRWVGLILALWLGVMAPGSWTSALAVQPEEVLKDPALEARARALSAELRCLVCQNESIDDSNAPLARDLRLLVRERLVAGDSDAAIRQFLVARYGTFVLLKPPFNLSTALLWLGPLLVLGGAGFLLLRRGLRAPPVQAIVTAAPLSEAEERALQSRLSHGDEPRDPSHRAR